MDYDVIVLGAGAAGLFCAAEAGLRGRRVLLVDHAKAAGEKIRISGGGRCNFTNLEVAADRFLSANPRFALSALSRFTQWDFISLVDAAGIAWHEKTLGQLFCDGSSKEIIAMLLDRLETARVELRLSVEVGQVARKGDGFTVALNGEDVRSRSVVVATGGKSIPKMGATGLGYQIASAFGLGMQPTRAGLVPLTFGPDLLERTAPMSGLSVEARVGHGAVGFNEGLLFTHRGLSGPSVLQISSYWSEGEDISVDLAVGQDISDLLFKDRGAHGKLSIKNALARHVPDKLAGFLVEETGLSGTLGDQGKRDLETLHKAMHGWVVKPVGSEGYRTAEVTLGGVDTNDLDAKTMEARAVAGLYFVGEVVDVTGWLGGYNFQWAWSSGWAAGQVC